MKIKFLAIISFSILLISCKSVIKEIYGVNRDHEFQTKQEYLKYITKKYDLDTKEVYLVPKDS